MKGRGRARRSRGGTFGRRSDGGTQKTDKPEDQAAADRDDKDTNLITLEDGDMSIKVDTTLAKESQEKSADTEELDKEEQTSSISLGDEGGVKNETSVVEDDNATSLDPETAPDGDEDTKTTDVQFEAFVAESKTKERRAAEPDAEVKCEEEESMDVGEEPTNSAVSAKDDVKIEEDTNEMEVADETDVQTTKENMPSTDIAAEGNSEQEEKYESQDGEDSQVMDSEAAPAETTVVSVDKTKDDCPNKTVKPDIQTQTNPGKASAMKTENGDEHDDSKTVTGSVASKHGPADNCNSETVQKPVVDESPELVPLPEGWKKHVHESGLLLYHHADSQIVTLSSPYACPDLSSEQLTTGPLQLQCFPPLSSCMKIHRMMREAPPAGPAEKRRRLSNGAAVCAPAFEESPDLPRKVAASRSVVAGPLMQRLKKLRSAMDQPQEEKTESKVGTDDTPARVTENGETEETTQTEDVSKEDMCFYGDKEKRTMTELTATLDDKPFTESRLTISAPNKMLHDALRSMFGYAPLCLMQSLESMKKLDNFDDRFMTIEPMKEGSKLRKMKVLAAGYAVRIDDVPDTMFIQARRVACAVILKKLYPDVIFYEEFKDIRANWECGSDDERLPNIKLHELLISKYGSAPEMLLAPAPEIAEWADEGKVWEFKDSRQFILRIEGQRATVIVPNKMMGRQKACEKMYNILKNKPVPKYIKDKLAKKVCLPATQYGAPINPRVGGDGEVAGAPLFVNMPATFNDDTPSPKKLLHTYFMKKFGAASKMLTAPEQNHKTWPDKGTVWTYDSGSKLFTLKLHGYETTHRASEMSHCRTRACELMLQKFYRTVKDYKELVGLISNMGKPNKAAKDEERKVTRKGEKEVTKKEDKVTAAKPKPAVPVYTKKENEPEEKAPERTLPIDSDKLTALIDKLDITPLQLLKDYIAFDLKTRNIAHDQSEQFVESDYTKQLITVKTRFIITKLKPGKNSRAQGRISVKNPPNERTGQMKAAQCMLKALFADVGITTYGAVKDFVTALKKGEKPLEYFNPGAKK